MLDFRYHVTSLAAVFLALIVGILVGVGISGRGFVDKSERHKLESRIERLQNRVDELSTENDQLRDQQEGLEKQVRTLEQQLAGQRVNYERNVPRMVYGDILWGLFNSTEFAFNH